MVSKNESIGTGKVYVIGLGPGNREQMTLRAVQAIKESKTIIGYHVYIKLINDLILGKKVLSSGMGGELGRCKTALLMAGKGEIVALVSSGDAGIYGMAGPLLELNSALKKPVDVEIVPGITAASMASSLLGAALMHDTALISLSDLLTPWEVIEKRLRLASEADFVIGLYNPRSKGRPHHIERAREIMLETKKADTVVGIVRYAAREGEQKIITTLKKMLDYEIDMFSVVIIGNSYTYVSEGKMITPRGYSL